MPLEMELRFQNSCPQPKVIGAWNPSPKAEGAELLYPRVSKNAVGLRLLQTQGNQKLVGVSHKCQERGMGCLPFKSYELEVEFHRLLRCSSGM